MTLLAIEKLEKATGEPYGAAHIRGTDITVYQIVLQHHVDQMTPDEIASVFELDVADIYAALAYYYDNKAVIDRELAEHRASYENERVVHGSRLKMKLAAMHLDLRDIAHYLRVEDHAALDQVRRGERPRRG